MRINEFEKLVIKQSVHHLDNKAKIILFGSRVNDAARGGDIDLLIVSDNIKRHQLGEIRWQLWEQLGEQKIDIVLSNNQLLDTFAKLAFSQGVVIK